MVPQAFISYVRQDKGKVEDIYRWLSAVGVKPWMDKQDVLAGQRWKSMIEKAIRGSDFFLACLSPNSVNRRGFLQSEIRQALEVWKEKLPDDIYLIPVLLEECQVPECLADFQWVEMYEEDGWSQLLKAIQVGMQARNEAIGLVGAVAASPGGPSTSHDSVARSEVSAVKNLRPVPAEDLPANLKVVNKLPLMTFPHELERFMRREAPEAWEALDEVSQRFLVTLGTKLEPIVQIIPQTPVPLVIGFENLALGALGENFAEICKRGSQLEPGVLRLLMTLAALKTTSILRDTAAQDGKEGVWSLLFTINLDPEMLDCDGLRRFLKTYRHYWDRNVIFEVNERTSRNYLRKLKELQVDLKMRFCADDFNNWEPEVKRELKTRVEMSKVDYSSFRAAMDLRGDEPQEAIRLIAAHRIANKALIVEGVENESDLEFLREHWPSNRYGQLFGQGYFIEPGRPWDAWTADLRNFGLPGGHFLMRRSGGSIYLEA